jgi:hypothetical protein
MPYSNDQTSIGENIVYLGILEAEREDFHLGTLQTIQMAKLSLTDEHLNILLSICGRVRHWS